MTKDDSITFLLKLISDLTSARILSEDKLDEKTFEAFSRMVNGFSRQGNSNAKSASNKNIFETFLTSNETKTTSAH